MRQTFINLKKIFWDKIALFSWIIAIFWMMFIFYIMGDFQTMQNNFWIFLAYLEIFLEILTSLFFWLFVSSIVLKIKIHWKAKKRVWIIWSLWWFLSILVTWCGSCSLTLAYYVGLWWLVWIIPYNWIFLKIIGLILMTIWLFLTLRDLDKCPLKAKK